jgi:hypothetical protein
MLSAQSQNKEIFADTTSYAFKRRNDISQKVGLPDLMATMDDFRFRYSNYLNSYYQYFADIWKNNDSIGGTVTNYVERSYGYKNRKRDTIIQVQTIDSLHIQKIYELVADSVIWNLPVARERKFKHWEPLYMYSFEYVTKNGYWLKDYEMPENQSVQERVIVTLFTKQLDSLLSTYNKQFEENLPKRGCYHSSPLGAGICYGKEILWLGYLGSANLPWGYSLSTRFNNIGSVKTDFGIWLEHCFNNNSYNFSAGLNKGHLFIRNDALSYNYQQRNRDDKTYRNHKIYYGLSILLGKRWLYIGSGIDFLKNNTQKAGGIINVNYQLPYQLRISLNTSIFEQHVDYRVKLSKTFRLFKHTQGFFTHVFFERFEKKNDIGFGLSYHIVLK